MTPTQTSTAETAPQKVLLLSGAQGTLVPLVRELLKDHVWELVIATLEPDKVAQEIQGLQTDDRDLLSEITIVPLVRTSAGVRDLLQQHQPQSVLILMTLKQTFLDVLLTQCIALKTHCLITSESPYSLSQLTTYDESAKAQGVSVITGVNQVPGLTSVVIDTYAGHFSALREVFCGTTMAQLHNQTTQAPADMVTGIGEPFKRLEGGNWKTAYGWQDLQRYYYGDNIGYRWHANRNSPEIKLLPERYPELKTMICHTGVEKGFMQGMLWHLSWLRRLKLCTGVHPAVRLLGWLEGCFQKKRTARQGMVIKMEGVSQEYQPLEIKWSLVVEHNATASVTALICHLVLTNVRAGQVDAGVQACLGMFTLEQFDNKLSDKIYHTVEETQM